MTEALLTAGERNAVRDAFAISKQEWTEEEPSRVIASLELWDRVFQQTWADGCTKFKAEVEDAALVQLKACLERSKWMRSTLISTVKKGEPSSLIGAVDSLSLLNLEVENCSRAWVYFEQRDEKLDRLIAEAAVLRQVHHPDSLAVSRKAQAAADEAAIVRTQIEAAFEVAASLYHLGKYSEMEPSLERMIRLCEGGEAFPTAHINTMWAMSLSAQGRSVEALEKMQAAHYERQAHRRSAADVAVSYGMLGDMLRKLERIDESLAAYRQAFALLPSSPTNVPSLWVLHASMGMAQGAAGQRPEAAQSLRKALELAREIFGPKHPQTAQVYHLLGHGFFHDGQYAKALTMFEKAYFIRQGILGEAHEDTALSHRDLAHAILRNGEPLKALAMFAEIVSYDPNREKTHPALIGTTYLNIGEAYFMLNRYDEAIEALTTALRITVPALSPEDVTAQLAMTNMGKVCEAGFVKACVVVSRYSKENAVPQAAPVEP